MVYKVKANGKFITKPLTKKQAQITARNLRREMKIAIPKYRWAKNIQVVEV